MTEQCPLCGKERDDGQDYCLTSGCGWHFASDIIVDPQSEHSYVQSEEKWEENKKEMEKEQKQPEPQSNPSFVRSEDEWEKERKEMEEEAESSDPTFTAKIIDDIDKQEFANLVNQEIRKNKNVDYNALLKDKYGENFRGDEEEDKNDPNPEILGQSTELDKLVFDALNIPEEDVENVFGIEKYIEHHLKNIRREDVKTLAKGILKVMQEIEADYTVPKNIKYARVKFFS